MKQTVKKNLIKLVAGIAILAATNYRASSQTGTANAKIDINNVNAQINILGDNFDNLATSASAFEVPKNSGKHTIFASSLWLGGYQDNNLKIAAMTYRQSGIDFFPGPIDTTNATTSVTEMNKWNQVWKVTRAEINDFLTNHTISSSIANWPANGTSGTNEAHNMAPYIDVNHDGKYNPLDGDYPDIKGDEMLWWVFNDNGGIHSESKGAAMGVEIHASAFAWNSTNEAINNTVFFDYKVINRSKADVSKLFLGLWTDFDLGYAFDDYVGAAPKLSAYYCYNGSPNDAVYGTNTPVQSVIFMKDSMSRFLYYNNDANIVNGNPGFPNSSPQDYYNYISGVWKNAECMKYGQNGVKGTQCTNYMFDGDPSDTTAGWTEHNAGNLPGDRRGIGSIGPFSLKAGETFEFPFAYVFSQKTNGNTAVNFTQLKDFWQDVKHFYKGNYTAVNSDLPANQSFRIFPNPAANNLSVLFGNAFIEKIVLIDNTGRQVKVIVPERTTGVNIDLSGLTNGIYTIVGESKSGVSAQKLVLAR